MLDWFYITFATEIYKSSWMNNISIWIFSRWNLSSMIALLSINHSIIYRAYIMDNYESIHKLSMYSENFDKFNKYDLYSISVVLCDFAMVSFNWFPMKFLCFSVLNDFRVLDIWLNIFIPNITLENKMICECLCRNL